MDENGILETVAGFLAAVRLCIGNIAVLVAGECHGESGVQNEPLGKFGVECDVAAGGSEGILHIFPAVVGIGVSECFGNYGNSRPIVAESCFKTDVGNKCFSIVDVLFAVNRFA